MTEEVLAKLTMQEDWPDKMGSEILLHIMVSLCHIPYEIIFLWNSFLEFGSQRNENGEPCPFVVETECNATIS